MTPRNPIGAGSHDDPRNPIAAWSGSKVLAVHERDTWTDAVELRGGDRHRRRR